MSWHMKEVGAKACPWSLLAANMNTVDINMINKHHMNQNNGHSRALGFKGQKKLLSKRELIS